jgi:hypothetical protein
MSTPHVGIYGTCSFSVQYTVNYGGLLCTLIYALNFFINPCFKIENKSGTMFSLKSRSETASENVAKRPHKSIILEEKMEVI